MCFILLFHSTESCEVYFSLLADLPLPIPTELCTVVCRTNIIIYLVYFITIV